MHPNPAFRQADAAQNIAFARARGFAEPAFRAGIARALAGIGA